MPPEFIIEFNPTVPEFEPLADYELIDRLEQLINTASIPEERKRMLYSQVHFMTIEDSWLLYNELTEKQIDRISSGLNYNQGEIIKHLRKLR